MSTYDINLLSKKSKSMTERLLYFALHYFRYIVVLTQIVVISVFFYRLTIDQQIIDLKESFRSKQQILSLTIPLLEEAQATQDSTAKVESLIDRQESFSDRYEAVISTVPEGMIVIEVEFNNNVITIKGVTTDTITVQRYYRALQNSEALGAVSVEELNLNADFQFAYTIEITNVPDPVPEPGQETPPAEEVAEES